MSEAEEIIQEVRGLYIKAREVYPNNRDMFYLALVWAIFAKKHHKKKESLNELLLPGVVDTMTFSLLESPKSIEALSYYLVYKSGISDASEYEDKFNKVMEPFKEVFNSDENIKKLSTAAVNFIREVQDNIGEINPQDFSS